MEEEMKELIPAFEESIFKDTRELLLNIGEFTIKNIFSSEVVGNLPIATVLMKISKIGLSLHERNLMIQTCKFIEGLNSRIIIKGRN